MKMNVNGQGACSKHKMNFRKTSVRWLGHASSVLPAATRHPVLLFSSFSSLKMTQNLFQTDPY